MSKICFLGDAHFGARSDSIFFADIMEEFFNDQFFPYLIDNKIDTVIQFGDLLDHRKNINFVTLDRFKRLFLRRFDELGIKLYVILGNHDVYSKTTNKINSLDQLIDGQYKNIELIQKCQTLNIKGLDFDMIPWINKENYQESIDFIDNSNSDIAIGHLEITGFEFMRGQVCQKGNVDRLLFKRYYKVFSGHFHHQSHNHNIRYIGTPYELNWSDYNDPKGFWIFDTETKEEEFIKNTNVVYHKIMYDDTTTNYDEFDVESYRNKFVKVVVVKRESDMTFERFLDKLGWAEINDLGVIETAHNSYDDIDVNDIETKDTLAIINDEVKTMINCDSSSIMMKIKHIYQEALSVE